MELGIFSHVRGGGCFCTRLSPKKMVENPDIKVAGMFEMQ